MKPEGRKTYQTKNPATGITLVLFPFSLNSSSDNVFFIPKKTQYITKMGHHRPASEMPFN